jgi:hypothetical protein
MPKRERDDELRFKRLEAAICRINAELTSLGVQLQILSTRVDRVMDGTGNALTEVAAKAAMAKAALPNTR